MGLDIAGDVGAGQAEFAGRGGQVRGAARGPQVQADGGVFGAGRAAVVGGELQRQLPCGEDLQDLGQRELCRSGCPQSRVL